MRIRDIMIDQPIFVSPNVPLSVVINTMTEKNIGFMVVAEHDKAVGIISEGDLVRLAALGTDMKNALTSQHMHTPVYSVQADANVFHAYDELVLRKMRHLVVANSQGHLAGVVTMSNFIANLGVEHFSELQTVSDIMHPVQTTVTCDTLVTEAIMLMNEVKHAMVVLKDNKPIGIFTSRGITRLCKRPHTELATMRIGDVMTPPTTIHRKSFVQEASLLMKHRRTRHLAAVGDNDEFMGLVTISDVAHSMEGRYVEFMRSVMRDMEHDLLAAGGHNRALFERNPNSVFSLDLNGRITHVNPACILLTGHGSDDLISKDINFLYDSDCKQEGDTIFASAKEGNAESVHLRLKGRNNKVIHIFMSFVPILVSGMVDGVYAVAFDITDRVVAEVRLHKLSQALQQTNEPILITDTHGVIEFANKKAHLLFAYDENKLVGINLTSLEHPSQTKSIYEEKVWPEVIDGMPYKGDFLHSSKNGKDLDLRLSCSPVHVPGSERIDYFTNIYEDMSIRRENEQQVFQARKMETIGTLAGGIAHDFNNYLGTITASLYMLKVKTSHMPDVTNRLTTLEKLTDRAATLVSQLLTFSRKDSLSTELISCSNLLEETRDLSQVLIPKKVVQHWHIDKHIYTQGNAGQMQQILLNLLNNACYAIKGVQKPEVNISLSTIKVDKTLAKQSGLKLCASYAVLTIKDNGCGISQEHLTSIFDPFFTTKGVGEGTGMGLAMVYGAMQSHHGLIDVHSKLKKGTTFTLYFPLSHNEHKNIEHDKPLILLVDDEVAMLEVGAEVLEELGFQVVTSTNGDDGFNLFQEQPNQFKAIILDVMMPHKDGTDTAKEIRNIRPDIPIIFTSGYDQNAIDQELVAQPNIAILPKPWKAEVLEETLKTLLEP